MDSYIWMFKGRTNAFTNKNKNLKLEFEISLDKYAFLGVIHIVMHCDEFNACQMKEWKEGRNGI